MQPRIAATVRIQFEHRPAIVTPALRRGAVERAIAGFDAVVIGPGSFYTSLMPIFLVNGVADALKEVKGPVILVANLLTEGRGMQGFTAADAVERIEEVIERPVDVVITNDKWPASKVLHRYRLENKEPLVAGNLPPHCEIVSGEFWTSEIARHDRRRARRRGSRGRGWLAPCRGRCPAGCRRGSY